MHAKRFDHIVYEGGKDAMKALKSRSRLTIGGGFEHGQKVSLERGPKSNCGSKDGDGAWYVTEVSFE